MTSLQIGCQAPRVRLSPEYEWSAGEDCGFLSSSYGLTLDEWQQGWATDALGEDSKGRLTAGTVGIAVPRQNGKNGVVEAVQLYKLVVQGRRILHTAHEVKTARKHFIRMKSFFDNERKYPELYELARGGIRQTNGQEAIVLSNGASIEFSARSRGAARGYTVDDLFCDEAQELTDEQLESLLPTISAAPSGDPQQYYLGTPPPERSPGLVFPRVRATGVAGEARRFVWWEWSIPDDSDLRAVMRRWRAAAYETNPALGVRLNIQTVRGEKAAMALEGFARERLGWWRPQNVAGDPAISYRQWDAAGVDRAPEGVPSLGIAFSADGQRQGVAGAVRFGDGPRVHVELVGSRTGFAEQGVGSLVHWLTNDPARMNRWRFYSQIVVSGASHSGLLVDGLLRAGVPQQMIVSANSSQYFLACATFYDGVLDEWLTHSAVEGQNVLRNSVLACDKKIRSRAGAWGWEPVIVDGDETPLEAASLAVWSARTTRRVPLGPVEGRVQRRSGARGPGRRSAGRR